MGLSRRTFSREFKLQAVRRLEMGVPVAELARALEVNPNVLHRWRREQQQGPGNSFPGHGKRRWPEGRVAELERKVGQQTLEIDFLRDCLQRVEEQGRLQAVSGKPLFTKRSKAGKRAGKQPVVLSQGTTPNHSQATHHVDSFKLLYAWPT